MQIPDINSNPYDHESLNTFRRKIIQQAIDDGTGFLEVRGSKYCDELKETIIVAKRPFERWAISRNNSYNLDFILPWNNVCPSGLKMPNDCEDHSDWWLSAGLSLSTYRDEINDAVMSHAYNMKRKIQKEILQFDKMVLCNAGKVTGRIKLLETQEDVKKSLQGLGEDIFSMPDQRVLDGDIIVIPHAGIEFEEAFRVATQSGQGGVICVIPNKVAHLCKLAREQDVTIMCDPDAFKSLRGSWNSVTLDPDNGKILGISGR